MLEFVNMPMHMPQVDSVLRTLCTGVGEKVGVGEILFTYELDGALFEERSTVTGAIVAVFFNENEAVSGGIPVMAIEERDS